MIDTCEKYCKRVRDKFSSRNDGKSSVELAQKHNDNDKRRRSKDPHSTDHPKTSKDDHGVKVNGDENIETKKVCEDKPDAAKEECIQSRSDSPAGKRLKIDDNRDAADEIDQTNAVEEVNVNDVDGMLLKLYFDSEFH